MHKTNTSLRNFNQKHFCATLSPSNLSITLRPVSLLSAIARGKAAEIKDLRMAYSDSDASSVGSIVEDASEPDTQTFKCLFCEQQWSRVDEMATHCKSEHSFDLATTVKDLGPSSSTIVRALPLWDIC
jgi:hypothetical protein